ncbi:MAG: MlaD family protein [Pseudomonadota bacterium]
MNAWTMDRKYRLREQLVGLFLVVTLVLSAGAVIAVGRGKNWFSKHEVYHTTFKEGYGLQEGSTVKMFNAEIGRVRSIKINDDNEVEVTMSILADYARKLRRDSVASVQSPTLVGSEYISMAPGSRRAPLLAPGGYIASIPRKSISGYVDELGLKDKFAQLGTLLETLTKVTEDVSLLTAQLRRPDGPLLGAVADVKAMTGQVRSGKGSLGRLLAEDRLYDRLDRVGRDLERVAANLDEVTANLKPASARFPAVVDDLGQSVRRARSAIENIKRGSEDLPALVTNTDEAVRQFRRVIESAKTLPLLHSNLPPDTRRDQVTLDPRGM